MGWTLLALGIVALPALPQDLASLPADPLEGRILFESKSCSRCHGIDPGEPGVGPSLSEGHFGGSFLEMGAALWNHVPGMSVTLEVAGLPWPEMTAQEALELIVFLYFIDYLGRPGAADAGEAVFDEECGACHNLGGGEARVGPDLADLRRFASPMYIAQEIWNHGPSMLESIRVMGRKPPTFREGDLADLSAFIRRKAGPGPREPLLSSPGNPARGRELFSSMGCSVCHGSTGEGGSAGPNLGDLDPHRPAETIAGTMWNHAFEMQATMSEFGVGWPEFAGSDLSDVVAFLYFLPFADPPGDPERGGKLFESKSCAGCHASDSAPEIGTDPGPDLAGSEVATTPADFIVAMWNHAPIMKRAILREGRPWPELTGEDLRDLRSFLVSLAGPAPGQVSSR